MKYLQLKQTNAEVINPELDSPSVLCSEESKQVTFFDKVTPYIAFTVSNSRWHELYPDGDWAHSEYNNESASIYEYLEDGSTTELTLTSGVNKVEGLPHGFGIMPTLTEPTAIGTVISFWYSAGLRNEPFNIINVNVSKYKLPEDVTSTQWMFAQMNIENSMDLSHWDMSNVTDTKGMFWGCRHIPEIILPNTLTTIGLGMFAQCESLTALTIPSSVTTIDNDAFQDCFFDTFKVPSTVTTIKPSTHSSYRAFESWNHSRVFIYESPVSFRDSVGGTTGENVEILVLRNQTSLSSHSIGEYITSLTLGNTISEIEAEAFTYPISLTEVIFEGTVAQWNAISKAENWLYFGDETKSITITCTDGSVMETYTAP